MTGSPKLKRLTGAVVQILLFAGVVLNGCTRSGISLSPAEEKALYFSQSVSASTPIAPSTFSPDWEKHAWVERVARLLRGGRGLSASDPRESLANLATQEKGEIIDILMADPLFGDAVLDFNLYFLGAKPDQLVDDPHKAYNPSIFDYPQAISSAREVLSGGDYLKLLDYNQPIYVGVLGRADGMDAGDSDLPPMQLRQKLFAGVRTGIDELITWVEQTPSVTLSQFCVKFGQSKARSQVFFDAGLPTSIALKAILAPDWYGRISFLCGGAAEAVGVVDYVAELKKIRDKNDLLFARLAPLEKDVYVAHDVRDVRTFELSDLVKTISWTQFGFKQVSTLVNSSTNYDRKRAAYVLKRFFCDDLTPIAVENPTVHAQDKHGSDPSCLACHYKLDPMAGFFKDYGIFFNDFSKSKKIFFDDQASVDRDVYEQAWKAPLGANREWNIGYIRSVNQPQLNDYGSSLEDLFAIIRKAPETRACLVKRMFEYFVGTDRMLDTGYQDSLTQQFNAAVAQGASVGGFKATVKALLLSNSFAQVNPEPDRCYDMSTSSCAANVPPCAVAYVLQRNCVRCHESAETGYGGLDLAHWSVQRDGSLGFTHLDELGAPYTRKQTFDSIVARLTSTNLDHRMPKGIFMSSADRERLYRWALKEGAQ